MKFARQEFLSDMSDPDPQALCARLDPWGWAVESGCRPPPWHDPARLPLGEDLLGGLALTLSNASMIGLSLGPALIDRLGMLGCSPGPLAGLAVHELITNAVVHGNLRVASGCADQWQDIAERQAVIALSLADPERAMGSVTIAAGWRPGVVVLVVADQGDGYDPAAAHPAKRGAGRGLRLVRMAGRVDVACGGRQTAITIEFTADKKAG